MSQLTGREPGRNYPRGKRAPPSRQLAPPRGRFAIFWRVIRIGFGFLLLGAGVVGLFLPVLQGVLMILAGLALLGRDLPWARRLTDRMASWVRKRRSRREPAAGPQ